MTAEQQNELLAVALPGGRVLRRIRLPTDPENVIGAPGLATVAVSANAGAVTLLDWRTLRVIKVFRGFRAPHLAAYSPEGEYVYVTDDGSGELVVIRLARPRIVARLFVGVGAHHLAVDPQGRTLWIALGERARSVAIVDTRDRQRPRLVRRFSPGFTVHDLAFSPDGKQVWLTSDDEPRVHVLGSRGRRLLFSLAAGPPPQHVAFNDEVPALSHRVWLTSGYGGRIELADTHGRVLRVTNAPNGSFNLVAVGGLVVASSLLNGTLSEFDSRLHPIVRVKVAGSTRDLAVTIW